MVPSYPVFIDVCIAENQVIPAGAWISGLPLEALRSLAVQGSIDDMALFCTIRAGGQGRGGGVYIAPSAYGVGR